jgi:hypothetical protein
MRIFYTLTLFTILCGTLSAQALTRERTADLRPLDYAISGDAVLEEFDDGSLKLRLTSDFSTPAGPDVRIFLSDGATATGGVEVVDLSAISHFSGARTFDVRAGVTLEQYSHIFFYCRAFAQPWADGVWGEPTDLAPGFECLESLVTTNEGVNQVDICTTDGWVDTVFLQNNISTTPGEHYVFLLTDTNEIVQEILTTDNYDFENTGTEKLRVYGLHFDGELEPAIGETRRNTTATGCNIHSGDDNFVTVDRTATCATSVPDRALAAEVTVYPNPATSVLNVDLPDGFRPTQAALVNALGQMVQVLPAQAGTGRLQLNVSGLAAGQYLLRMEDGQRLASKRISIAH